MTADDFARLAPHLSRVSFDKREILVEARRPLVKNWFFEAGYGSIVAVSEGGAQAEVGLAGREGMASVAAILGADSAPFEIIVQCEGSAYEIPTAALQDAIDQSPTLRALMLQYAQTVLLQVAHSALAAASQSLRSRLARWLLMCDDRVEDNVIPMTHEFLSLMLCVRRPGVTETVNALVDMGAIEARRGAIVIADREMLMGLAGDGYGAPERLYADLIGATEPADARSLVSAE